MEPERALDYYRSPPTRRHSRRHVRHRLLLVPRHVRIHLSDPSQRKGDTYSRKSKVLWREQRDSLPKEYRYRCHDPRQLLRPRSQR